MGRKSTAKPRLEHAASALFSQRGYHTVSVDELCKAAGVHKGTFYHFFGSKDELFLRHNMIAVDALRSTLSDVLTNYTGREAILKFCEALTKHFSVAQSMDDSTQRGFAGCVPVNVGLEIGSQHELARVASEFLDEVQTMFCNECDRAQANGNIPFHKDANELGNELFDSWFGACARVRFERSPDSYGNYLLALESTLDELEN